MRQEDIEELQKVDPTIRALTVRFKDSDNDRAIICDDFGTRIQFLARATGGGRGFTGDDLYLDEALYLTDSMLGDILPASSAIPNAQIYYLSSHPKRSHYALLKMVRNGRAGSRRGRPTGSGVTSSRRATSIPSVWISRRGGLS